MLEVKNRSIVDFHHVGLPDGFVSSEPIEAGEWIEVDGDNVAKRVTGTPYNVLNTFPVALGTGRQDVLFSGKVQVVKGAFSAETDRYDRKVEIKPGTLLKVMGDGDPTVERGHLTTAASGDMARAICENVNTAKETITFRFLDGYNIVP